MTTQPMEVYGISAPFYRSSILSRRHLLGTSLKEALFGELFMDEEVPFVNE